jgi:hypothetical protein
MVELHLQKVLAGKSNDWRLFSPSLRTLQWGHGKIGTIVDVVGA